MNVETIYAALLVLPLFALVALVAALAALPRRCPVADLARAEADWCAMVSEETAPIALAEIMAECSAIDPDAALARWSEAMADLALADAHAASLAALARSSARIDAAARRSQFALVASVALDHGAAWRDAA